MGTGVMEGTQPMPEMPPKAEEERAKYLTTSLSHSHIIQQGFPFAKPSQKPLVKRPWFWNADPEIQAEPGKDRNKSESKEGNDQHKKYIPFL